MALHPSRTENGAPRWRATYSSAPTAELVTERIESNMRPLCSSRNGCAGVPATSVLSSAVPATTSRRYSSLDVVDCRPRACAVTALKKVRA